MKSSRCPFVLVLAVSLSGCGGYAIPWYVSPELDQSAPSNEPEERSAARTRQGLTKTELELRARCALSGNNALWADAFVRLARVCHRDFMQEELTARQYNAVAFVTEQVVYVLDEYECRGEQAFPFPPPRFPDAQLASGLAPLGLGRFEAGLRTGECQVTVPAAGSSGAADID